MERLPNIIQNIYISRRPPSDSSRPGGGNRNNIGHKAAVGYDVSSHPAYNDTGEDEEEYFGNQGDDDINYSMFDLNVDSIDVTLSLWRWFDGKGLVEDAVVKGVRGVLGRLFIFSRCAFILTKFLDRRSVRWDPDHPRLLQTHRPPWRLRAKLPPTRGRPRHSLPTRQLQTLHRLHLPRRPAMPPETMAILRFFICRKYSWAV